MSEYSLQVVVDCNENYREILMAELAAIDYDSIQETEAGFLAHRSLGVEKAALDEVFAQYKEQAQASYHIEKIAIENWNQQWENSFEPIIVEKTCIVRASYHNVSTTYPIEIIINPKMSFGTGHHETTYLMMKIQLQIDHQNRTVLDAGCGTGILSILAGKLGAKHIDSYDSDLWVKDNIQENFKNNNTNANIYIGTIDKLNFTKEYNLILANINKNILLHDIPYYAQRLSVAGSLVMSGFYQADLKDIQSVAETNGLKFVDFDSKNDWAVAIFSKI